MSTKFKRAKRPEIVRPSALEALPEQAPSAIRPDEPVLGRYLAMAGLILVAVGCSSLLAGRMNWRYLVPGWLGSLMLVPGIGLLLFHAANERDLQYRRVYGVLGFALLAFGVAFRLIPYENRLGGLFFPLGLASLLVGLFFILAFVRVESDEAWRMTSLRVLGGLGLLMAVVGLFSGVLVGLAGESIRANVERFFFSDGLLLAVLGLIFLSAFVVAAGAASEAGFRVGLAIGLLGLITALVALGRTFLPYVGYHWLGWIQAPPAPYFIPGGLILLSAGLVYLLVGFGICSELRLVVLTRRELSAFFYSPVAYLVLLGMLLIFFYEYWLFVEILALRSSPLSQPMPEPIVFRLFVDLIPVICLIFVVPLLTMRLLSEEKRTGTLEVLLTAPVNEGAVVWSKFLAALLFFLLIWAPLGLFLLALRVGSGEAFDYRPLLSFALVMFCTGAGFISMGLFFSSLTDNQIIAAVLTFVGMIAHTATYLVKGLPALDPPNVWHDVLTHVSYIDLWLSSLRGTLAPRDLLVHLSAAAFFLFLTAKVLESRKWK